MPDCWICGKEASIFTQKKWWCEKHYQLEREKRKNQNQAIDENIQKLPGYENKPLGKKLESIKLGLEEV